MIEIINKLIASLTICFGVALLSLSDGLAVYETPARVIPVTTDDVHTAARASVLVERVALLTKTPADRASYTFRRERVVSKKRDRSEEVSIDAERYARWRATQYGVELNEDDLVEWYRRTVQLRRNSGTSRVYETHAINSFGLDSNNSAGAELYPVPGKRAFTRPDGRGLDKDKTRVLAEHKHLTPGTRLYQTEQIRAQQTAATSNDFRHVIIITSPIEITAGVPQNPPTPSGPLARSISELRLVSSLTGDVFRWVPSKDTWEPVDQGLFTD